MIAYVHNRHDAELRDVSYAMRALLQQHGGIAWFSRRRLSHRLLYRGSSRTLDVIRELVEMGELCRVSAPGRGQGRGRTLYWLPRVTKTRVLRELKREAMPYRAIVDALRFFIRPENGTEGHRQQSLRSSTSGTELRKRTARDARSTPQSHDPPKLAVLPPSAGLPLPPPRRGLAKHGVRLVRPADPSPTRITEDPVTHPVDCECEPCSAWRDLKM